MLLERSVPVVAEPDERLARQALREQIARLELQLAGALDAADPVVPVGPPLAGPRLLSLGDLERLRDRLAQRLAEVRDRARALADEREAKRLLVEAMLLDPVRYRWVRVTNADLGLPGCKSWHVRPRLGLIGMLAGWWHVKVSSGCPLAT